MQIELKERFANLSIITERRPDGKSIYKFSGPFQEMADVVGRKNRNGRRYTKELWQEALKDESVMERLKSRRMLGELDHPTDEGQIRRTSHIVTKIEPDFEKGVILGELELLNHDQGDAALLRALVDQGVQLCVSSRGFGEYLEDGCTIDPQSYRLVTWDVVLDPSVSIAQLNRVAESVGLKRKYLESGEKPTEGKPIAPAAEVPKKTETIKPPKENDFMEKEMLELIEKKNTAEVSLAVATTNLTNMTEKLEAKNLQIAQLEKANQTLQGKFDELRTDADTAAGMLEKLSLERATLKNENKDLKAKVEEYETLGNQAAEVINTLTAKNEEMTKEATEAVSVIEKLMARLKEQSPDKPEKPDTGKGAVGKDKTQGEAAGDDSESEEDPKGEGEGDSSEEEPKGEAEGDSSEEEPKGEAEGDDSQSDENYSANGDEAPEEAAGKSASDEQPPAPPATEGKDKGEKKGNDMLESLINKSVNQLVKTGTIVKA